MLTEELSPQEHGFLFIQSDPFYFQRQCIRQSMGAWFLSGEIECLLHININKPFCNDRKVHQICIHFKRGI